MNNFDGILFPVIILNCSKGIYFIFFCKYSFYILFYCFWLKQKKNTILDVVRSKYVATTVLVNWIWIVSVLSPK